MNMDSDHAFLSLLSSQRELLNRLNMETEASKTGLNSTLGTKAQPSNNSKGLYSMDNCTNHSIAERRSSLDFIMSRRFSLGFGCDHSSFELTLDGKADFSIGPTKELPDLMVSKRSKDESFGPSKSNGRKKRRMSSLGFLNPFFFEENLKQGNMGLTDDDDDDDGLFDEIDENEPLPLDTEIVEEEIICEDAEALPQQVGSLEEDDDDDDDDKDSKSVKEGTKNCLSEKEPQEKEGDCIEKKDDHEAKDDDEEDIDDDTSTGSISVEPIDVETKPLNPSKLKKTMESFHKSMEMSQNSQQAIHDWDRKMGLKRSHSKTMRLTMRSRKKLKAIMKKELTAMVAAC